MTQQTLLPTPLLPPWQAVLEAGEANFTELYAAVAALYAAIEGIGASGLPLASNEFIEFIAGAESITGRVVPGRYAELLGDNIFEGSRAFSGLSPSTVTTKQNDYSPPGFASCAEVRCTGAASLGITSFLAQVEGFEFDYTNHTAAYLRWLEHESGAVANNRITGPNALPMFLFPGDTITLRENLSAQRWRVRGWPSRGKAAGFTEFNDYITEPAVGSNFGAGSAIANPAAANWSTLKAHGVVATSTGSLATGRGVLGSLAAPNVIHGHGPMMFMASTMPSAPPDATENFFTAVGFSDIYSGVVNNGAYWELRFNATTGLAEWVQTVMAAGVPTTRTIVGSPPVTVSALSQLGVFWAPDGSRVDFLKSTNGKNYEVTNSISTGLPAVGSTGIMSACLGIQKLAGVTPRAMYTDWTASRVDSLRA